MKKVFVVILNWNGWKDTVACLKSVAKLKRVDFELQVIVVDNGSSDNSVEKISKHVSSHKDLAVILLESDKNLGFTGGNNMGIKYALSKKADYVLFLNNDTVVEADLLVELIKVFKTKKRVGIVSPLIYFGKGYEYHKERYKKEDLGKVIWFAGGSVDWEDVTTIHRGVDEVDTKKYKSVEKIQNANGSCMLVCASVFENIGLLDDAYYLYWEETDFCQRAKMAGWSIYFTPKAVVWHNVAASSAIGGELHDYFLVRNKLLFGFKYASMRTKLSLFKWSMIKLIVGSNWQRIGVVDYYTGNLGVGSWKKQK